jgi:hypothetical protein
VFSDKSIWLETKARREVFSSAFQQGAEAISLLLGAKLNQTTIIRMQKRWKSLALTAELSFLDEYDAAKVLMVLVHNQELVHGEMVDAIGEMTFTDIQAPGNIYQLANGT